VKTYIPSARSSAPALALKTAVTSAVAPLSKLNVILNPRWVSLSRAAPPPDSINGAARNGYLAINIITTTVGARAVDRAVTNGALAVAGIGTVAMLAEVGVGIMEIPAVDSTGVVDKEMVKVTANQVMATKATVTAMVGAGDGVQEDALAVDTASLSVATDQDVAVIATAENALLLDPQQLVPPREHQQLNHLQFKTAAPARISPIRFKN